MVISVISTSDLFICQYDKIKTVDCTMFTLARSASWPSALSFKLNVAPAQ